MLKDAWHADRFGRDSARTVGRARGRGGGPSLAVDTVTGAVRDPSFWAYLHMCAHVQGALDELSSWCERCPCHSSHACHREGSYPEARDARLAAHRAESSFPRTYLGQLPGQPRKSMWSTCPCKGKRAPELACSGLLPVFASLWEPGEQMVIARCAGLAKATQDAILADWQKAFGLCQSLLASKTAFWNVLPWRLCGMGHFSLPLARESAQICIDMYDRRPTEHKKTLGPTLGPGPSTR